MAGYWSEEALVNLVAAADELASENPNVEEFQDLARRARTVLDTPPHLRSEKDHRDFLRLVEDLRHQYSRRIVQRAITR